MPRSSKTPSLFPDEPEVPSASQGRDEMNFAEFPLAVLSSRAPSDCNELVFEDTCEHKGKTITRRLTVTALPKYGLPTVKDEEVLLGLLALTKLKNNFTDRVVRFTRYELLQLLGLSDQGHGYKRIISSLDCWASTYLKYENSWWDNGRKTYVDGAFHVIDEWIATRPDDGMYYGEIDVKWSDFAFKSFQDNYVKRLDLDFYQSLETGVAKRLYRYLDKHLYRPPHSRDFDLEDLAFCHLGLSKSYEVWKVKQKIEPGVRELEERGYLARLPFKQRFTKISKGKYAVHFEKAAQLTKAIEPVREVKETPKVSPLVAELVSRGITEKSALLLEGKHSAEEIGVQLEAFDWLMNRKDKRVSASPPGYLFKSIEEKYPLPHGFTPAAVLKQRVEMKAQTRLEAARKQKADDERSKTEKVQADERKHRVNAYLCTLSDVERSAFEAAALSNGPSDVVEAYHKALGMGLGSFSEMHRYRLLEHAMPHISSQAASA